jgi:hypothetical protein
MVREPEKFSASCIAKTWSLIRPADEWDVRRLLNQRPLGASFPFDGGEPCDILFRLRRVVLLET